MIRKIALGAAAALLVVGLPVAALGITNTISSESGQETQVTAASSAGESAAVVTTQDQTQMQQRLRIHAETGVPDGVTPTQARQRLHTQDQAGTQSQGNPQARGQGHGNNGGPQGTQPGDGSGNQHGKGGNGSRSGNAAIDGTGISGECTNPDGPIGNGPHGGNG